MKMHRSTSEAVVTSLAMIFGERRYADKVIEKVLKQNPRWGARDRRFIAETTYDIVRWYRLYRFLSDAGQHDYWHLLATWCVIHNVKLPPWQEFERFSAQSVRKRQGMNNLERKVRESVPDWLDERGETELGEERWTKELHALNKEAPVVLRANRLKVDSGSLQAQLADLGVTTHPVPGFDDALVLETRQNVFSIPPFKEGLFEVQDAGSQLIAPFLRVEPGMRIIDACAGAGGKTLHLAALCQNKGRIIAMDTEAWKLEELQRRARRAGASNIETRVITSAKVIKRLAESADRLLLDVPCSGMGVLKRNPDAKWKLSPEFVDGVRQIQQKILSEYSRMLKPGGLLVYATCSVLPSENEQQVEQFLLQRPDFTLVEQRHVFPSDGFDGFYMALLKKEDDQTSSAS